MNTLQKMKMMQEEAIQYTLVIILSAPSRPVTHLLLSKKYKKITGWFTSLHHHPIRPHHHQNQDTQPRLQAIRYILPQYL